MAVISHHDADWTIQEGVLLPGMTICLEATLARPTALKVAKLEQQILMTETGYQLLSTFPFEDAPCTGAGGNHPRTVDCVRP
jgi:Xaa-Pro aminopeptidase